MGVGVWAAAQTVRVGRGRPLSYDGITPGADVRQTETGRDARRTEMRDRQRCETYKDARRAEMRDRKRCQDGP